LRAEFDQFVRGVVCVQTFAPEGFVVPEVFANGDAEFATINGKEVSLVCGLEVAWIVEDVILGE
jgi:hypothetical protein